MQFAVIDSTSTFDGFFDFRKAIANAAAVKDDGEESVDSKAVGDVAGVQEAAAPVKTDAGTPEALREYFALDKAQCAQGVSSLPLPLTESLK
jgi:hypothetical protein